MGTLGFLLTPRYPTGTSSHAGELLGSLRPQKTQPDAIRRHFAGVDHGRKLCSVIRVRATVRLSLAKPHLYPVKVVPI
jgi:hypothetical protein